MIKLEKPLQAILLSCLKLQRDESLHVLCDQEFQQLAQYFWQVALRITSSVFITQVPEEVLQGHSPAIGYFLSNADVGVILTSSVIHNITPYQKALAKGVRIAYLPKITEKTLQRIMAARPQKISNKSKKLADIFSIGKKVSVTSINGMHLTFSISHEQGIAETGLLHKRGTFSILPGGRALVRPNPGTCGGEVLINGSLEGVGLLRNPVILKIKEGYITKIYGGEEAQIFRRYLNSFKKNMRYIVRLGVGTNHRARLCGHILEDERAFGTLHLGIGDSTTATSESLTPHYCCGVLLKPNLVIDGRQISQNGKFLV